MTMKSRLGDFTVDTSADVRVFGVDAAFRALEHMKPSKQRAFAKGPLRSAAAIYAKELRRHAKGFKRTGALSRSFATQVRTTKEGDIYARVGARRKRVFLRHEEVGGKLRKTVGKSKKAVKPGRRRIMPSRYSHLAEKKHGFHKATENAKQQQVLTRFRTLLAKKVKTEAAKAFVKSGGSKLGDK